MAFRSFPCSAYTLASRTLAAGSSEIGAAPPSCSRRRRSGRRRAPPAAPRWPSGPFLARRTPWRAGPSRRDRPRSEQPRHLVRGGEGRVGGEHRLQLLDGLPVLSLLGVHPGEQDPRGGIVRDRSSPAILFAAAKVG